MMAALPFIALATLSGSALAQKADRPVVKVGDEWQFFKSDDRRAPSRNYAWIVTSVTPEGITGAENGEPLLLTPDMNVLESPVHKYSDLRLLSFPLEIGKSWAVKSEFLLKDTGSKGRANGSVVVLSHVKVRVPAGDFDAFKLEMTLDAKGRAAAGFDYTASTTYTYWYAPSARAIVRQDIVDSARGPYKIELTGLKLQP
jgi:hypothetical protein